MEQRNAMASRPDSHRTGGVGIDAKCQQPLIFGAVHGRVCRGIDDEIGL
jgi:hypothetical protein